MAPKSAKMAPKRPPNAAKMAILARFWKSFKRRQYGQLKVEIWWKSKFRESLGTRFERCWLEFGLSWLMLELCCDIFGGKMATKSPKMSQDGAQEPQDEPIWRPGAPRWRPRGRHMQPRWRSWVDFGSFWDEFSMIWEASWLSG